MSNWKNVEIANWFLQKGIDSKNLITQMQLHKLVYFAHALSLAKSGDPLVNGQFEAWQYGPVLPELYTYTKSWGSAPSASLLAVPHDQSIHHLQTPKLSSSDSIELCETTWNNFSKFDGRQLSNISHEKGSPWDVVYKENQRATILDSEITKFYRARIYGNV